MIGKLPQGCRLDVRQLGLREYIFVVPLRGMGDILPDFGILPATDSRAEKIIFHRKQVMGRMFLNFFII